MSGALGRARGHVAPLIFVVFISALAATTARAGGDSVRPARVTEGTLFWRTAQQEQLVPAPVLKTDVHVVVRGIVARASVRQEFSNPSGTWAEGIYVFPLPDDAAVDHMRMQVGDRTIEGVVEERTAAKARYAGAKHEGTRASLVEEERPNIFTTSVANIPPGASIAVEIEYQQTVRYDAGQFRLRFPMVVGPRYVPATHVPDASRITPPVGHPSRGALNPVSLRIELDPGTPLARLEASAHEIQTTPLSDGRYGIELAQGSVPADRDFELVWEPFPEAAPTATLFTERRGEETFALLMVMPPAPAALDGLRLPREAIFVIDNSGSMHGASIDQAKAALELALGRLRPSDTFNVIRFNQQAQALFPGAQAATPQNLRAALRYVSGLRAEGGTEMLPALRQALDGQAHPGRLRQVIFLTDGAVGNEGQLFSAIDERLGDSRLFTIGIGSAPNSHFMREAARLGRGTFTDIGSTREVKERMVALFGKLEAPALTDVQLELPGGAAEIVPERIPDVYLGEPVTVALRAATLPPRVVLRGHLGLDLWERELALQPTHEGVGLSVHWARGKIAALLDRRRSVASDDDVRHAVLGLALAYHLVSPYTSLVAVDVTPLRPRDEPFHSHALATNLPHGWDYTAVVGLGQGATPAPIHLALGLTALLLAAGLGVAVVRRDDSVKRRTLLVVVSLLAGLGLLQLGQGAWIHVKARVAQHLLQRAWTRSLHGEPEAKPWPWADTWPVARLLVPAHRVDLIVLAGVSGRTLAFGPGHAPGSAVPGAPGTAIVTGHRDTHFRFLERVKRGDEIAVEVPGRRRSRLRVRAISVVDSRTAVVRTEDESANLILMTCYPFDAVAPGGPLRYVVTASAGE